MNVSKIPTVSYPCQPKTTMESRSFRQALQEKLRGQRKQKSFVISSQGNSSEFPLVNKRQTRKSTPTLVPRQSHKQSANLAFYQFQLFSKESVRAPPKTCKKMFRISNGPGRQVFRENQQNLPSSLPTSLESEPAGHAKSLYVSENRRKIHRPLN